MISLLQLQYFSALAKEQSLSKTAEQLFVSQSTLSTAISKLERDLGVQLFDREKNRIYLNEFGKLYLKYIDQALFNIEHGRESVQKMQLRKNNLISMAASHSRLWKDMAVSFMHSHPPIYIKFKPEHLETYQKHLEDRTLDFVITGTEDLSSPRLASREIRSLHLCLVAPVDHPLAKRESISLQDLNGQPYVDLAEGLSFRQYCDRIFESNGVQIKRVFECEAEARPAIIMDGAGIGVTPDHEMMKKPYQGLAFVPIREPDIQRSISLFWLKDRELSPILQDFIAFVLQWLSP